MRWVMGMLFAMSMLGGNQYARGQAVGTFPVGRPNVYQYTPAVPTSPIYYASSQPISNQGLALPSAAAAYQQYAPQQLHYSPQQSVALSNPTYAPTGQHYSAPRTAYRLPSDVYWGMAATGRVTYFRPGHVLGNLIRAFGYTGPPLTP